MYQLFWEVFKKTGSIEAYLYLYDHKSINRCESEKREKLNNNGNCEYPGNNPQGC